MRAGTRAAGVAVGAGLALLLGVTSASGTDDAPLCAGRPATYVGTPGADHVNDKDLRGTHRPVVVLMGGHDAVNLQTSGGGVVRVCTGAGPDRVSFTQGTTFQRYIVKGGSGSDELAQTNSPDFAYAGPDWFVGGPGADLLIGSLYDDKLLGGPGRDKIYGEGGDDLIKGAGGEDKLYGLGSSDRLFGGSGNDLLDGDSEYTDYYSFGEDLADGGGGTDTCEAERRRDCELLGS